MNDFEESLNSLLVDTFNSILKFEEKSLRSISGASVTVTEAHILEAIGKSGGGASVSEISALLRVTLPTVTVAIGVGLSQAARTSSPADAAPTTATNSPGCTRSVTARSAWYSRSPMR